MKTSDEGPEKFAKLRWRAEEIIRWKALPPPENFEPLSPEETRRTIHELRVHQIELKMQNDELRRAQADLDAARARYFDLYDLAPVGYCIVSQEGLVLEANLTAVTLLGVARVALVKQPITRFIFKEDQDIYYLHRKQFLQTGEPHTCELRMMKNDGTTFWVRLATTVGHDPATNSGPDAASTLVTRVVISDISDRKQVETEKAQLEAKLQQPDLHSPIGTGKSKRGKTIPRK